MDGTFRNNNPAVFGIRIDVGILRHKIPFMNMAGRKIGNIHQLQLDKKTVTNAKAGDDVACSVQDITIGRQIFEEEVYSILFLHLMRQNSFSTEFMHKLSSEEQEVLNDIVRIQREKEPVYAY